MPTDPGELICGESGKGDYNGENLRIEVQIQHQTVEMTVDASMSDFDIDTLKLYQKVGSNEILRGTDGDWRTDTDGDKNTVLSLFNLEPDDYIIELISTANGTTNGRIHQYVVITVCSTSNPTDNPTPAPTNNPTASPTYNPTPAPTLQPTNVPTSNPTVFPTHEPTTDPTNNPTVTPTDNPTVSPTSDPSAAPTTDPTTPPTTIPTSAPTSDPSSSPTIDPTINPTVDPTKTPTTVPTISPISTV